MKSGDEFEAEDFKEAAGVEGLDEVVIGELAEGVEDGAGLIEGGGHDDFCSAGGGRRPGSGIGGTARHSFSEGVLSAWKSEARGAGEPSRVGLKALWNGAGFGVWRGVFHGFAEGDGNVLFSIGFAPFQGLPVSRFAW